MATEARVPHAMFPEGALSRDGGLQPPRLGLLSYVTRTFDPRTGPDIVFVPIGTNYDRVPEERTVIARAKESFVNRGTWFVLESAGRFIGFLVAQGLRGRRQPFGYACANFGTPVSFANWLRGHWVDWPSLDREGQFRWLDQFARELMADVRMLIPVLPVSTLCAIYRSAPDASLTRDDLVVRFERLQKKAREAGGHLYAPADTRAQGFDEALNMLIGRRILVRTADGHYRANEKEKDLIAYYANSIDQFVGATGDRRA